MKKILSILFVLSMALSMYSCGDVSEPESSSEESVA